MNIFQIAGSVLALSISTAAYSQDAPKSTVAPTALENMSAADYVAMAASSDMFEIQCSELAVDQSKSESVQTFAKLMMSDHSATTKEIMSAAQKENIVVPKQMLPKHAVMLENLKSALEDAFDAKYVEAQVRGHQEAVALHTAYAKSGDDTALKAVATKAVPIVTEHLNDAQALSTKV